MNINIDFGEVLVKSWKIIWKFKVLWIFGILAGCAGGNGARFNNSIGNNSSWNNGNVPAPFRQFENLRPAEALRSFFSQYLTIIVIAVVLLCVLWLLFFFLGIMGKTGLIKGANKADKGAETLTFGELWTESLPYFWRMTGLSLLIGLPFFVIFVVLLAVLFLGIFGFSANGASNGTAVAGLFGALGIFLTALCCLGIVMMVIGLIVEQATNAIVLEDLGVLAGLSRGWEVFKRNFLTIILMAIVVGVIGGIVSFVAALPMLLVAIPFVAGLALSGSSNAASPALVPLIIAGVCFIAYLPILLVVNGIQRSYAQSALTLTYLRITASVPAETSGPSALPEPANVS